MRIVALVAVLAAALTLAFGRPMVAQAQTGSISITQHDPHQTPIGGGKAAIYQVGIISGSSYQYVGDFASLADEGYDLQSEIPKDPEKGKVDSVYLDRLESVARDSSTSPLVADIGSNGRCTFDDLQPGAYLVVQAEPAPGYNSFDRFLVTIPWEGSYNVDASPKLDPVTTTTTGNNTPNNPGGNPSGSNPSGGPGTTSQASVTTPTAGGTLPQTGQLWWPVAVLAIAGVALFVWGRRLNGTRKHES